MKKDTINERLMTTKQQVGQMNHYWKDLDHMASDVVKKKNMDRRFGIKNIKLDRYGNIISFDKYKRGAHEDHDCNVIHPKQSHKEWEKEQKESVDWKKFDTPYEGRHGKKFDSWDEWEKVEKEREKLEKTQNGKKQKKRNKTYEQYIKEVKGSTAALTLDRLNPPTIGHEKLLKVIESTATKNDADQFIFLSQSQDVKKNPLTASLKLTFMKLMFPKQRGAFPTTSARTALEAMSELHERSQYSKVIMVVGSDRVREFDTLLNRYNDTKSKHGYYRFEDIDVISAGERDPDAEGAGGMSASKMRDAVQEGKYDLFKMGVPAGVSEKDCHNLYNAVAKGMKVNIKEGMEYTIEEIEETNSLIEEIDTLCKNSIVPILREDQMCEFLLLKKAVSEDKTEELRIQAEASKVPSKGLSPAQRRRMSLRMKIQAKKPGFIKKRLRALKRAATKAVIAVRARKAAIKMVVKKFFPKLRTKKKSELSMSDRVKISQIVKKKSKIITRFAKKLLIKVRKTDVERRKSMSGRKDKAGVKGES